MKVFEIEGGVNQAKILRRGWDLKEGLILQVECVSCGAVFEKVKPFSSFRCNWCEKIQYILA